MFVMFTSVQNAVPCVHLVDIFMDVSMLIHQQPLPFLSPCAQTGLSRPLFFYQPSHASLSAFASEHFRCLWDALRTVA